jgi:ribonuclease HI
MPSFTCRDCGAPFSLSQTVLDRYPGWTPSQCMDCRPASNKKASAKKLNSAATDKDPTSGVFTDGSAVPNPGEGGWGAVYVLDGSVVGQASGYGGETTNNRMELTALIEAVELVPAGGQTTVYSDSKLAVQTINEWAEGWKRRGWKRKSGAVENLDLVKKAYDTYRLRPDLTLVWIKAHVGYTWNEYADELANEARAAGG